MRLLAQINKSSCSFLNSLLGVGLLAQTGKSCSFRLCGAARIEPHIIWPDLIHHIVIALVVGSQDLHRKLKAVPMF